MRIGARLRSDGATHETTVGRSSAGCARRQPWEG